MLNIDNTLPTDFNILFYLQMQTLTYNNTPYIMHAYKNFS